MNLEELEQMLSDEGIVFLSYGGMLSQKLITNMVEALENEINEKINLSSSIDIFTVFVELSQNIMNYSKEKNLSFKPRGLVLVGLKEGKKYYVLSRNAVTKEDKENLEKKLNLIQNMTREEIKEKYKELRREDRKIEHNGAGIGFYEIAKRCENIEYEFKKLEEELYQFSFIANINEK